MQVSVRDISSKAGIQNPVSEAREKMKISGQNWSEKKGSVLHALPW
jgi:hypothetical protein